MLSIDNIRQRLNVALAGGESLDSFEDWLDSESFLGIHQDSAPELRSLVAQLAHSFDLHAEGYIDDSQLRRELRQMAGLDEVQELALQFTFDDLPVELVKPDDLKSARNSQIQIAVANFA